VYFKVRGHRDHITVVGTLPQVQAGEWLEAQGRRAIDGLAGLARTSGVNLSGESFRFFEVFRANIWLQQRQVL